jgi:hypothetical protein
MEHSPGLHALGYSTSRYEMNGNRGVRLCSAEAVAEGKCGQDAGRARMAVAGNGGSATQPHIEDFTYQKLRRNASWTERGPPIWNKGCNWPGTPTDPKPDASIAAESPKVAFRRSVRFTPSPSSPGFVKFG